MWGGRLRLHDELVTERTRREELTRRVDAQQATITFLCARLNQVEHERALLFRQLTNIDLPVPTLQVTQTAVGGSPTAAASDMLEMIASSGIFDDDPRHAPAGWHDDGRVNYGSPAAAAVR